MASEANAPASAPPADTATLPAGYRINEYLIERSLGGGGFGITYLARDSNLDLPVAIKEYFPNDVAVRAAAHAVAVRPGEDNQASYDWGLERFLDEARALAAFRHPNIVRVLRYFLANGTAYIVMEYESGLSLKRWVPQNAPLTQRLLLSIIYPLLDGLESVHQLGFLHRDIKPDNIYVRADGTPVLLDFGAARRVSANRDMTNIVSPGFAPFEQYHSDGNQGPWTDIYSLGAVMYWMTTGKRPAEAAARVKQDAMLPASSLAEVNVYGAALLHAIEWAMHPDEGQRPQTVAQLRAAIQGSERPDADAADARAGVSPAGYGPASGISAGAAASKPPSSSSPSQRRTLVCTIMFLDLVGYSARSVENQVGLKKLFNELIGKALKGVPEDSRIAIDTGDGAAICFMGDPEEALHSAMLLRDLLGQRYGSLLSVRIGLHMGPVRVIADINDRVNVVGDGINVAQRVMDFAQANQLLVSRAYYDVISRITDDTGDMFQYVGQHEDKHGRRHEVYAVEPAAARTGTTRPEGPSTGYSQTVPLKTIKPLEAEAVHDVEAELARHIGPLARVLVRKAQPLAQSIAALREALAPSIQDAKARESFIAGSSNSPPGHTHPLSKPRPGAVTASRTPAPASRPSGSAQGPSSQSMPLGGRGGPLSQPMLSQPRSQPRTGPISTRQVDITPEELAIVEHTLSKFIGPMARVLVRKQVASCTTFKEFVAGVAATVDHPQQREVFLQALKRGLPRRQV
ncbi:MAG: protein kinase [Gemmatimonadetes bacterium]|nr:protein kinase [Gemmatimonadota bacterium]